MEKQMYNRSKNLMKFVDDYVLVDIETTGLSPINDEIIEIGAIKVENNLIVDSFSQLIKINRSLSPFITNLYHHHQGLRLHNYFFHAFPIF